MLNSERGQTLVEVIIASAILVIVSGLATMITARVYTSYEVIKAENEARKTIEETLHTIAYGDGEGLIDAKSIHTDASYQIGEGDFTFIEKNNNHYIRYVYDSSNYTLERREYNDLASFNLGTTSSTAYLDIAGNIDFYPAVKFQYFTNNETEITGVTAANVNQITRIRIKISVVVRGRAGSDYHSLTVYTSIRPLNLYNL